MLCFPTDMLESAAYAAGTNELEMSRGEKYCSAVMVPTTAVLARVTLFEWSRKGWSDVVRSGLGRGGEMW